MTQTQARTSVVTLNELLEAGVHFGHQTRRWNPKMKRFIFGERNGIYIIDLKATLLGIESAYSFVRDLVADGGTILFVSTKRQMTDLTREAADRCGMPYVNFRWLGGMLTNFQTIHSRIDYLRELEDADQSGLLDTMKKKEALKLRRERDKLDRYLGGMRQLDAVPDAIFVIDTKKEHIAVTEACKKGVPVVATLDTNCDPDEIDYGIPANDDAIRAGRLMARIIADAVDEGKIMRQHFGGSGRRRKRDDPEAELLRAQAEVDAQAYEEQRAAEEVAEAARDAARVAQNRKAEVEAEVQVSDTTPTSVGASRGVPVASRGVPVASRGVPVAVSSKETADEADDAATVGASRGVPVESRGAPVAAPGEEKS